MELIMKEIGEIQEGTLILDESQHGEIGLLRAKGKRVETAIWFDSKQEAIEKLQRVLDLLRGEGSY